LDEATLEVRDQTFSVNEISPGGTAVGSVVASGPSEMLTYRIVSGNTDNAFAISSETGEIMVNSGSLLDYETTPFYSLVVEVSDEMNTVTAVITVNISEAGAMISDQAFSVDENIPDGTSVGTVAAGSPDPGAELTFRITEGNTENLFAIHSKTGEITVSDSSRLDYETMTRHTLTVEVSDGTNIDTATITVNIRDVSNEHDPVISDQTFSVNENSISGTSVGTVSAKDNDPDNRLTYKITEGNTENMFELNSDTGELTVGAGNTPDYETVNTYILMVEVSDGTNTAIARITITVNDLNEEKLTVNDQMFSADENSPEGTPVGTVVASGTLDTLAYRIIAGNTGDAFAIDSETGRITVWDRGRLDYESVSDYSLTIEVSDGSDTVTVIVTININDLDELTVNDQRFFADEKSIPRTPVGRVVVSGSSDRLTYGIVSGNTEKTFEIVDSTGEIIVGDNSLPDYGRTPPYELVVEVSNGTETVTVTVTITITKRIAMGWLNPLPTGNRISGLWGTSGSDIFAVGDVGTILRYNGADWISIPRITDNDLHCISGFSRSDIFAAGDAGTILHYDGTAWAWAKSGISENIREIRAVSDSEVFAAGDAGAILHYNRRGGSDWIRMNSSTSEDLHGMWGASGSDLFVTGNSGTILHYDGAEWHAMNSGTSKTLNSVWGVSDPLSVFAVGDSGTILRYDGAEWHAMNSGTSENLTRIWGTSGSDVFAAGDYGTILHYDGIRWNQMESSTSEHIRGVWGDSGTSLFTAGNRGIILHYDGVHWRNMSRGIRDFLKDIRGRSHTDIFAVGGGFDYDTSEYYNTILHYDGIQWNRAESGSSEYLYALWRDSGTNTFAVGWGGLILYHNGTVWHTMAERHIRKSLRRIRDIRFGLCGWSGRYGSPR
jgi:hypothetical protein